LDERLCKKDLDNLCMLKSLGALRLHTLFLYKGFEEIRVIAGATDVLMMMSRLKRVLADILSASIVCFFFK